MSGTQDVTAALETYETDLAAGFADINANFVLQSGYLVFFMHAGFLLISIGCVRARFAKHIAILILVDACASALGFYLFGFAFAYGKYDNATVEGNPFVGGENFALSGLDPRNFYFWFFQWAFAATACTIVSGAIAERTRLETYVLYSFFMAAWVYPIVVRSIWAPVGWASPFRSDLLFGTGAFDFAGSGAVHMVGGIAAACGCAILGPRLGRYVNGQLSTEDFSGHNTSLFVLGVMVLWFGWYGFNPGSQLALIGYSPAVATAAVCTTLSPAAAGLSSVLFHSFLAYRTTGRLTYDIGVLGNGALAGLVGITASCSIVQPWAAVIIGFISGGLYVVGSLVSIKLHLDDPLDAIAVHAWNGTWGVIAVGLFADRPLVNNSYGVIGDDEVERKFGLFMGGGGKLLGAQIVYALWIAGWVCAMMIPFFWILHKVGLFRVSAADENMGLDHSFHGGSAYKGGHEDASDVSRSYGNQTDVEKLRGELAVIRQRLNNIAPDAVKPAVPPAKAAGTPAGNVEMV